MLSHISKWLLFRLHLPKVWVLFSDIYSGDLLELLNVKVTKIVPPPPHEWVPWSFELSELTTLSLQRFVLYSSGFSTMELLPKAISAPESCNSPYPPVCPPNSGNSSLLCDLTSLTDLRKSVDFSVCSALYLWLRAERQFLSSLHAGIRSWKSLTMIFSRLRFSKRFYSALGELNFS